MVAPEGIAARVAVLSIVASAALAGVKIYVGLHANSVSLVSDGFESGADFVTSGLVLVGLMVAAKPADADHPYGHGRFETLIGLGIGFLLAIIGATISFAAVSQRNEQHTPALLAVWTILGSVAAKGGLLSVKMRVSRNTGSDALRADAWNDFVDILSGGVALVAVLLSILFPDSLYSADHYGGFVIGIIVIFMGLRVIRETTLHLMDTMPDEAQMAQLRETAMRVPGALAIEKCFARKTGLRYHVDLHLEVNPQLTVLESHEIARSVKKTLKANIAWVQDVLVHVEPHFAGADRIAPQPAERKY